MNPDFQEILDGLPEKLSRSRLEPYRPLIEELRRRGRTYQEIVKILEEKCQLHSAISTVNDFMRRCARRKQNPSKSTKPEAMDPMGSLTDTSAVHFLEQLATEVEKVSSRIGRHLVVIAESDLNDPRLVRSREAGGYGIEAQWSDDFQHSIHAFFTGDRSGYYADFCSVADIAKALKQVFVYDGRYSAYRRRRHGRPATGLGGHRFVAFIQNHDQIGNRIRGDRSCHLMSGELLKTAAALLFCSPFIPMLFQGE